MVNKSINKTVDGVSLIVCCYNSQDLIEETLQTIAVQITSNIPSIEVLLIDNSCIDNTVHIAKRMWQRLGNPFEMRIIPEHRAGLSYAKECGVHNSMYRYIIFVDDDNSLDRSYTTLAYDLLKNNPQIAICGGQSQLPSNLQILPKWWANYQKSYAVGKQHRNTGEVQTVWGAGMCINKILYIKLLNTGFKHYLTGRNQNNILSGEDTELCLAFQLIGYKVYYSNNLKLIHRVSPQRINNQYLKLLISSFGKSHPYLSAYWTVLKYNTTIYSLELIKSFILFVGSVANFTLLHKPIFHRKLTFILRYSRLLQTLSISANNYNYIVNDIKKIKQHDKNKYES